MDDLPKTICDICIEKCNAWLDFKEQCKKSNKTLAQRRRQSKIDPLQQSYAKDTAQARQDEHFTEIKLEPVVDESISDFYIADATFDGPISSQLNANKDFLENNDTKAKFTILKQETCVDVDQTKSSGTEIELDEWHSSSTARIKNYEVNKSLKVFAEPLGTHECDMCEKKFVKKTLLQKHKRIHIVDTSYQCDQCGKIFDTARRLSVHRALHGEKKFKCSQCEANFASKKYLTSHLRRHNDSRPFRCEVCGNAYKYRPTLDEHIRRNHANKPYACPYCPDTFATEQVTPLQESKQQRYLCDFSISFKKQTLNQHMKKHL